MSRLPKLATVAIPGPLRRTFTYHLADNIPVPALGQRVMVEFGRTRMLGFFLGETTDPPPVKTKPIKTVLDADTYFPRDLFDLCLWMSNYYFANPADCLVAALPPLLKTHREAELKWTEQEATDLPPKFEALHSPGALLTSEELNQMRQHQRQLPGQLVRQGVLAEEWTSRTSQHRKGSCDYQCLEPDRWSEFFRRRQFQPQPFGGSKNWPDLMSLGWTDYYLNLAITAKLLQPLAQTGSDSILGFVKAKSGVTDLQANTEQQQAVDSITGKLGSGFAVSLLHGVTGSGKTLVYCLVAREVLNRGEAVLVLTPEIALSGAALAYLRGFFGDTVTVIHSAMTARERMESWSGIRSGKYRIVVGPRSALFAPLENLGLIVVDEEHDSSYKQSEPSPRFHGRDAAIMRAKINDIPIILGSATPSLESFRNAETGRYQLLSLEKRPAGAILPQVRIINMQSERLAGDNSYLSFPLKKEIDHRLAAGEQTILFLNRRGYSPQLKCAACGQVAACPHCEIKLTYHKVGRKLSCHYCGYLESAHSSCHECGSQQFQYVGAGTQKVEEHLSNLLKGAKLLRFDSDTASGRTNGHQLLRDFSDEKYNLLLGTQMVTKGLDLPSVTLVGVLSADMGLDQPDFRAAEKTFSRLLQVAGRAGRGKRPGVVMIQTYYPESSVIQQAAGADYAAFYRQEIESRRTHDFPPFSRLMRIVLSAPEEAVAEQAIARFATQLDEKIKSHKLKADLLGPAPCPRRLIRNRYRHHLLVRTHQVTRLVSMLSAWESQQARFGLPTKVRLAVDVDPDEMI